MKLHHTSLGTGTPLVIVHGLFGLSDNWLTAGRMLSSSFRVILADLRNHGRSPHSDEMDFKLLGYDIHELIVSLNSSGVFLMGHSMGGKAVMQCAHDHPQPIKKLIIVDVANRDYPADERTLNVLRFDPGTVTSRREAEDHIGSFIRNKEVVGLFTKNLYWKEPGKPACPSGRLAWRFNAASILKNMGKLAPPIVLEHSINIPTLFIRGGNSDYLTAEDGKKLKPWFPHSEFCTINNAGHWVHAEKPEETVKLVKEFLENRK